MTDNLVPVGYVTRAHGIRGGVLVVPLTDHPERFAPGARFTVDTTPPGTLTVRRVAPHKEGYVIEVDELADRTAAERLAKRTLLIPAEARRPLEPDEHWPEDLIGLDAVAPDGASLGVVTDVVLGAAQDRLVVTTPGGIAVEVPYVAALVGEIAGATITITAPDGLFPGDSDEVEQET